MIDLARKRNRDKSISFSVQDAAGLIFSDNSFDAVFDFGIIHHIPDWKKALDEIRRVLQCGGWLIMDDLSIESFETNTGKAFRLLSVHPYESMFRTDEFVDYRKEWIRNYRLGRQTAEINKILKLCAR